MSSNTFSCATSPTPTALYTLSLHDALPISEIESDAARREGPGGEPSHDQLDRRADVLQIARHIERQLGFGLTSRDRKSTRLNSSHVSISYAVFCLKKKNKTDEAVLVIAGAL